jgi:hypothetical protein
MVAFAIAQETVASEVLGFDGVRPNGLRAIRPVSGCDGQLSFPDRGVNRNRTKVQAPELTVSYSKQST